MRVLSRCAMAAMVLVLAFAPSAGAADSHNVEGTLTGPGGFRFITGCGVITEIGNGAFDAAAIGRGTYSFTVCIRTVTPTITFDGSIIFTGNGGATLSGTIQGVFAGPPGPTFDVTLTDGTKRFTHVHGTLTVGPLTESNSFNCDFRVGICFDWTDTGPITGAVSHTA
jgi:hypothetical protein